MYEYRGMGRVKPIHTPADSESDRNLMALYGDHSPVEFYPCEEEGLLYHSFTPGMTELHFLDLLFRKAPERPVLMRDGLPIIAPEESLLYKAVRPDEESARLDYTAVAPRLDDTQRQWLRAELARLYPSGHVWNPATAQEE
jgi:hypothetical protein